MMKNTENDDPSQDITLKKRFYSFFFKTKRS